MRETTVPIAKPSGKLLVEYVTVLAAAGLLYCLTCAPAILWQDSALFVYRMLHNDLDGNLGLALAHPLFILLGIIVKYLTVGDLAYRVNLLTAILGAVTIANLYLLVRLWRAAVFPAVIAAMSLALSWTFWLHATIGECYTIYSVILTCELIVLLRYTQTDRVKWLYWLAFLNGVSITAHMWGILPLGCYVVMAGWLLVKRKLGFRHVSVMAALLFIGASLYEYLIIKAMITTGDITGSLASAAFGNSWRNSVLNASVSLKMAAENFAFTVMNFPTPNLILLFIGVYALGRVKEKVFAVVMAGMMVLFFFFAFRYTVVDRHAFFFPFYVVVCVVIGLGAETVMRLRPDRATGAAMILLALMPIVFYINIPDIARTYWKGFDSRPQGPYRDDYTFWLRPWHQGLRGFERFSQEALAQVEANAVIESPSTLAPAMLYVQEYKHLRPDVKITSGLNMTPGAPIVNEKTIDTLMATLNVYVVSKHPDYCPRFILENYDLEAHGVLFKVVKRQPGEKNKVDSSGGKT
jgi:hypothetical protein